MNERIQQYANTVLDVDNEQPVRIDLRRPLHDGDRVALRELGLPATFAIITADNPLGRRVPDALFWYDGQDFWRDGAAAKMSPDPLPLGARQHC